MSAKDEHEACWEYLRQRLPDELTPMVDTAQRKRARQTRQLHVQLQTWAATDSAKSLPSTDVSAEAIVEKIKAESQPTRMLLAQIVHLLGLPLPIL
jgi:hypothetical protein